MDQLKDRKKGELKFIMAKNPRYLQKLGLSWYVRVKVPASLQAVVGNTHIRKALHTRDLSVAEKLKWAEVARIKSELNRLKTIDPLQLRAKEWREGLRGLYGHQRATIEEVISDEAEKIEKETGSYDKAKLWHDLATADTPNR